MIPLVTAASMKELDRRATSEFGLPAAALMEAAGHALAAMAGCRRVLVLCGGGNNGGDGFAAARHLMAGGVEVRVATTSEPTVEPALSQMAALRRAGCEPVPFMAGLLQSADLVIDALVGVGAHGALRAPLAAVVEAINASGVPVLAADVPSGLGAGGPCVRAARTLCLGGTKYECVTRPELAGEVSCDPLGIPPAAWHGLSPDLGLLEPGDIHLPHRPGGGHKGTFGTVVVVAGSPEYAGAGLLAAHAALRSGVGLTFLATSAPGLAGRIPEVIVRDFDEDLLHGADAVAIGPGLGRSPAAVETLSRVLSAWRGPLVMDADALNLSKAIPSGAVITPHPGEAGRLLGISAADVERDRLAAVQRLAAMGGVAVLKGAHTLIATGERIFVNSTGNDGMGKGGTGDVLTGLLGGLLAQGMAAAQAVPAAVYIHGLAGDLAAARLGKRAMAAGDLIGSFGEAFRTLGA